MNFKQRLVKLVERFAHIYIFRTLPHGIDVAYDIAKSLPMYRAEVVFDVGANIGQSAKRYLDWFPKASIYCFEPVRDTFQHLQSNLKGCDRVHCFQVGLGSSDGLGNMVLEGASVMFFLLTESKEHPVNKDVMTEEVEVITVDEFCRTQHIQQINFLKIDTEGAELEVLKGAETMLSHQQIDLVEVEAGMNPGNRHHMPFEAVKNYLESKQYFLFGIYEQVQEWLTQEPHLRRSNCVFISQRMIQMNKAK